jgi:hypothetical protein
MMSRTLVPYHSQTSVERRLMLKKILFLLTLGLATHINTTSIKANNAIDQLEHDAYHEISANLLELNCTDQEIADLITNGSEKEDLWRSRFELPQKKSKKRDFFYFAIGATAGIAAVALTLGGFYWHAHLAENKRLLAEKPSSDDIQKSNAPGYDNESISEKTNPDKQDTDKEEPLKDSIKEIIPDLNDKQESIFQNDQSNTQKDVQDELRIQAQDEAKKISIKAVGIINNITKKYDEYVQNNDLANYSDDNGTKQTATQKTITIKQEIQTLAEEFRELMKERFTFILEGNKNFKGNGKFIDVIGLKYIEKEQEFDKSAAEEKIALFKKNLGINTR